MEPSVTECRSMMNMLRSTLAEQSACKEIKVRCPKCHVTMMITKVADLRSHMLMSMPSL